MYRFMNKNLHAYLDYPVALGLIVMPFVFGLGVENTLALWLSVITGVAAFILTVFTDHHLGLIRVLPYKLHLMVDFLVGVAFVVAPSVLGLSGLDAMYYWLLGAIVLIVVVLDNTQDAIIVE